MIEELQFELFKIIRQLRRILIDVDELQLLIKDSNYASGRMQLMRAIDEFRATKLIT